MYWVIPPKDDPLFYVGPDVSAIVTVWGEVATSHGLPGSCEPLSVTFSFKVLTNLDTSVSLCL